MSDIKPITMESETLSALKADMDAIISKTIENMQQSDNGEATVSVKIKISLEKRKVPSGDTSRTATVPKFEHDVQSVVQIKDKKTGSMSGEYELVFDPKTGTFYMKEIAGQVSMFDDDLKEGGEAPIAKDENGNQICIHGVSDTDGDDEDDEIAAILDGEIIEDIPSDGIPYDEAPNDDDDLDEGYGDLDQASNL